MNYEYREATSDDDCGGSIDDLAADGWRVVTATREPTTNRYGRLDGDFRWVALMERPVPRKDET